MPDRRSKLRAALHRQTGDDQQRPRRHRPAPRRHCWAAPGRRRRKDGPAVVAVLTDGGVTDDVAKLAGDALLVAVDQRVEGAEGLASACVEGLRRRGWAGDDLLADQLAAALGSGPASMPRRLAVDLDELSGILEGDPVHGGGRVDRHTGVWHQSAVEYARETGEEDDTVTEDPDRWLWVASQGSRDSCRDMETFISTVTDPAWAGRLEWRSEAGGRSAGSRTPSPGGPTRRTAGTDGPKNAGWVEPGSGSPMPATRRGDRFAGPAGQPCRASGRPPSSAQRP